MNARDDNYRLMDQIEQAACAERRAAQDGDDYLTVDFKDGVERAARIAVELLGSTEGEIGCSSGLPPISMSRGGLIRPYLERRTPDVQEAP